MSVIVPIDADVDKAEHVSQEDGPQRQQRAEIGFVRHARIRNACFYLEAATHHTSPSRAFLLTADIRPENIAKQDTRRTGACSL
jgi:hypothetical protein